VAQPRLKAIEVSPERAALRQSLAEWKKAQKAAKARRVVLNWPALRKTIMERDGFVCRICGADPCEVRMHVHHVDWDRTNNKPRNLVTLCSDCHGAIHQHAYRPDGQDDEPWGDRSDS